MQHKSIALCINLCDLCFMANQKRYTFSLDADLMRQLDETLEKMEFAPSKSTIIEGLLRRYIKEQARSKK